MGQLNNLYVSSSFQGLLKMADSTNGLTNTLQTVQTGDGDNSPLQMSLTEVNISGSFRVNGVSISGGTSGSSGSSGTSGSSGSSGTSGTSGSSGSGFNYYGTWSDTTTYIINDVITYNGQSYVSIQNGNLNKQPSVQPAWWSVFSAAGSSGTSGTSGVSGSGGTSGTSGTSGSDGLVGSNGTSGTSGTSGQDGSSGTSGVDGSSGTSGVSPSLDGVITTGSITTTQQITGSLILGNTVISGSLITNTVNKGIIKIESELHSSSSAAVPYGYISSSSPTNQSNLIFNTLVSTSGSGLLTNQSGSIVISGSNNIMFNSNRTATVGTYGYLGGNSNIGSTYPTLGTGSLLRPAIGNNALQAAVSLQFTTSSLAAPSISSNLIYGGTNINHQSGSVLFSGNYVGLQAFTSNANTTTLGLNASIFGNIIQGITFPIITLNHNSSSITYQGNIGGGLTVNNNYSSSVSTAVNNITVTGNILGGQSNTLVVTGSNSATRRVFDNNVVIGRSNIINSDFSGGTGGHLVSTTVLGDNLIVSASHTSTTQGGTVIVGRFNATGSLQESSQEAVFVVGTGTAAGNRRNAIHVDNTNNIRMTGSVNVSGSLVLNGVTVGDGNRNGLITTGSAGSTQSITGSLNINGNNTTITGSLRVSGSMTLGFNDGTDNITSISQGAGTILYRNANKYTTAIGEFSGTQNKFADGTNNILLGGFNSQFSTGSQNFLVLPTGGNFKSGSINIIIGNTENIISGSQNILIGQMPSSLGPQVDRHFIIKSQSETNSYLFKSGSGANVPIQIGFPVEVTGSLNVNGNTTVTGSLRLSGSANPELIVIGETQMTGSLLVTGNVLFASGSDKTMGTFVLNGGNPGTATVSNSLVSATSLIFLTKQTNTNSGNGTVSITSKGTGTFNVTSDHNGDTDTVAYLIINPS